MTLEHERSGTWSKPPKGRLNLGEMTHFSSQEMLGEAERCCHEVRLASKCVCGRGCMPAGGAYGVPQTLRAGGRTPRTPRSGGGLTHAQGPHVAYRRAVLGTPKCEKSVGRRGSAPDPAGELTALPQTA